MKKVLATVAALGLVLGVTANALALDKPARASEVESTPSLQYPRQLLRALRSGQFLVNGFWPALT